MATSVGMSQARATPEQPAKITPQSILVTVIFSIAPPLPASETAPILPYRLRPRLWWREWELAAACRGPGARARATQASASTRVPVVGGHARLAGVASLLSLRGRERTCEQPGRSC